jgi:hypothetical protein
MNDMTRRRAVSLTAAAAAAAFIARSAQGRAQGEASKGGQRYSGHSRKGDLQQALDDAIQKALTASPGSGRQVRWALKEVSGVRGGFAPLNTLTVEVEATVI